MVDFIDIAREDGCDKCGKKVEGSINGNDLCDYHLTKYRDKNIHN